MKDFYNWVVKNLWNLFGLAGVFATFYFSLTVPNYVEDIATSKAKVVHESLIGDVQEILFNEKELSINDIESFIKGKELKQSVRYPYNADELLLQVQERFVGNKFLPLDKRENLLKTITSIRSNYVPPKNEESTPFNWRPYLSTLLSILGVIASLFGLKSIFNKVKLDKEVEIDMDDMIILDEAHRSTPYGLEEFENLVGETLNDLGVIDTSASRNRDVKPDFWALSNGQRFIVEAKRYRKLLGVGSLRQFLGTVSLSGCHGILVVSSGVTERTKSLVKEHNKFNENQQVYLVIGDAKNDIKSQLQHIFAETSNKSNQSDAA